VFVSSILEFGCEVAGHYSGAQAQRRGGIVFVDISKTQGSGEIPPSNK